MEPTVRQLRAFVAVATAGHFGRAAQTLGLAQPTLSKEIKLLERALGALLFVRGPGGAQLTGDGTALLSHAQRVLDAVDDLRATASRHRRERTGTLRVAATPSVVNRLLPRTLRLLEHAHPELAIEVVEVDTGGVPAAIAGDRADVGLGHHVPKVERCGRRVLAQDELFVVLHADLAGTQQAIDVRTLSHIPLLTWPREHNPEYHDALLRVCNERGLEPLVLTGSSRISGARSYVLREGRAFAIVPRDYAETELPPLVARPLSIPATVPLMALWRTPVSPAVQAFLRALR